MSGKILVFGAILAVFLHFSRAPIDETFKMSRKLFARFLPNFCIFRAKYPKNMLYNIKIDIAYIVDFQYLCSAIQ